MKKQFKTQELAEFKMEDSGNGSFSGYASTFDNYDSVKEAVVKGAFLDTLEQFKTNGFIALNHDWNGEAIAFVKNAYEDDKGLFVECEFHGTAKAQDVRKIMQERAAAGKSNRMSIGYRVEKATQTKEGKQLNKIKLYEASIVNVPANELATIGNVKSDNGEGDTALPPDDSKKTGTDINQLLVKAMLLGDGAEAGMFLAGLENLCWRLQWKIWETLGSEVYDTPSKINLCQAMIGEFSSIAMNAIQAFFSDPNAVATASAKAAEMKAGRVLSNANHAALKSWAESIKTIASEMDALLAETEDSSTKNGTPAGTTNDDEQARKAALELELAAMGL